MFFYIFVEIPENGCIWGGNYGWGKALFVRLRHKKTPSRSLCSSSVMP